MKKIIWLTIVLCSLPLFAFGQTANNKAEREVLQANEAFDAAIVSRDAAAYGRIVADEFVFTDFKGAVFNKAQEIEKLKTRKIKFVSGKSDDVRVKIYGKTAIVTGRFKAEIIGEGKNYSFAERYTAVFVKRSGRWQLAAEQSTEIAEK